MKICYIWVEKFRKFNNRGFNFSSSVKFHYDSETNILSKNEIKKLPINFFDPEMDSVSIHNESNKVNQFTEITGLIGKNGAGKSNLLDLLLRPNPILIL